MRPPAAQQRAYRADIDGLRALAVVGVVLYHAGVPGLTGGFTGVDIFFVISGYLIGGHIYAEAREGRFSFLRFYQRRARRILPAFFAVLAFALAAGLAMLGPRQAAELGREACAAVLSGSNVLYWATTNYFTGSGRSDLLLMTWSLGVEEQFYAAIPLLLVLLARRRGLTLPAVAVGCALSFGFAWWALGTRPMAAFYLLPARAWELGIGVALAVAELERSRPWPARLAQLAGVAGLLLMISPLFLLDAETPFPGPAALPSVLGAALAIAASGSWVNTRLFALAPLAYIGRISYSWYLWHWPLLALGHTVYGDDLPAWARVGIVAASFAAAVLSYCGIEQPFRHRQAPARPQLARYGAVAVALMIAGAALWVSGGAPRRFPSLARMETQALALRTDPCLDGIGRDAPNLTPECYGNGGDLVALWGDSHAAALGPAVRAQATAGGYGFAELAKASCPPLTGATHATPRLPLLAAGCTRFNEAVMSRLKSDGRVRVVILAAAWSGPLHRDWTDGWLAADPAYAAGAPTPEATRDMFESSLAATIRQLEAAGKQVVVIEDVPLFAADPLWRVESRRIPARRWMAALLRVPGADDTGLSEPATGPEAALANRLIGEATAGVGGVDLVDPAGALCPSPDRCAYRQGDTLLYVDTNHVSAAGAAVALRDLRLPAHVPAR